MDEEKTPLKQIRTFQGDIADALQKQRESLVSIQQAERIKTGSSQFANVSSNSGRKSFLFFLGSLVLISLAGAGIWFSYNKFVRGTTTPVTAIPLNRFLLPNVETNLEIKTLSRENLVNTIFNTVSNTPSGELRHVVLRKSVGDGMTPLLSTGEFLSALESRAPGSLVRSFDPLFMFGTIGADPTLGESSAFLVIKLASFENAFAGMLLWEKTIAQDLGPLFATRILLRDLPAESSFVDLTDRNKDIRALEVEGRPILLYSFFGNNMLIITDSLETLRTIIDRLTREQLSR